nr:650_t:CDS:2 [Entrophospora candida]CAG8520458.1 14456_t:CDS:2 [Entrophospora candida]
MEIDNDPAQETNNIIIRESLTVKNGHAMIGNSFDDAAIKLTEQLSKLTLENKKLVQEREFEKLFDQAKAKIEKYEQKNQDYEFESHLAYLNEVLDNQEDLTVYHNTPSIKARQMRVRTAQRQLELNKNNLLHILTKEELQNLCGHKEEITKLKLQLGYTDAQTQ